MTSQPHLWKRHWSGDVPGEKALETRPGSRPLRDGRPCDYGDRLTLAFIPLKMEHYFSHIWDMRPLAFEDARFEQHGKLEGMALYTLMAYETFLKGNYSSDRERAMKFVEQFSLDDWNKQPFSLHWPRCGSDDRR